MSLPFMFSVKCQTQNWSQLLIHVYVFSLLRYVALSKDSEEGTALHEDVTQKGSSANPPNFSKTHGVLKSSLRARDLSGFELQKPRQ